MSWSTLSHPSLQWWAALCHKFYKYNRRSVHLWLWFTWSVLISRAERKKVGWEGWVVVPESGPLRGYLTKDCIPNPKLEPQLVAKGVPDDQRSEILNMKFEEGACVEGPGCTATSACFQSKPTIRSGCVVLCVSYPQSGGSTHAFELLLRGSNLHRKPLANLCQSSFIPLHRLQCSSRRLRTHTEAVMSRRRTYWRHTTCTRRNRK